MASSIVERSHGRAGEPEPTGRRTYLPRNWLKQEAQAGRLPCLRVGRRLLFVAAAVEETLAKRAANPADHKRPE
jgi:hypothetical protein